MNTPRRHLAAVMFTDLADYTALMHRAEAAAIEARSRHREALYGAVPDHGGDVVQFLGDGSVSTFPSAVEAIRAAIKIQVTLSTSPRLPLRIGITQGEITYDEQGPAGDSVNIAARLQAHAAPGGIAITGKVVDEIRNHPDLTALGIGEKLLKGFDRPVAVYAVAAPGVVVPENLDAVEDPAGRSRAGIRVRGAGPARFVRPQGRAAGVEEIPALPLVGRDADLGEIRLQMDQAEVGRGRTLFMTGESGVGKTRLAEAARDEARRRGWNLAIGRANHVETDLPYALLADALLPTIERLPDEARTAMTRGVLDELAVLFPSLARLIPGSEPLPRARESTDFRNRLFWNFAQFVQDLGRLDPLLVVLEDLHWADASSLELLHFLARQTTSSRIVFIGTSRSDANDDIDTLRNIERSLISLGVASSHTVRPLTLADTHELVHKTFGVPEAMARPFTALLFGWTRGNPFFIEELLKKLVEDRNLRREGGAWVGWDLEELKLPESVREMVTQRATRLEERTLRVAELAAVLGGRFRFDQLEAVTSLSAEKLLPVIDELDHQRIIVDTEQTDVVSYEFGHPIVRETLYANLGRARAGVLHGAVAQALERYYGAAALTHAGELAYHYARAIDHSLADKAVRFLEAAGRAALATRADPEALKYLRAAMDRIDNGNVVRTPAETARTISSLAHAHQRAGQTAAAVELWKRARSIADEVTDAESIARIERRLGLAHYWAGHAARALEHFEAGAMAARQCGDPVRLAMLQVARGLCLQELGRADDALVELQAALQQAEKLGAPSLLARVHRALLLMYLWTGPPEQALAHGQRALELADQTGEVVLSFWIHWAMAVLAGLTGNAQKLKEHLGQCDAVAEEQRSPLLRMWSAEIAVEFAFGDGRWDEGIAIGENAISMARALNQTTLLPRLLVWTSMIYLGRNEITRARAYIDEAWLLAEGGGAPNRESIASGAGAARDASADRLHDSMPNVHTLIPAHIGRAALCLAIEDYHGAIEVAEAAFDIIQRTGYDVWAVHRLLPIAAEASLYLRDIERAKQYGMRLRSAAEHFGNRLGLAWADACDALVVWLSGDPARGAELMGLAAAALEAVPFLPDATRLRRQLAGRLKDIGDRDGALRELRHVHDILLRLGADKELERTRGQFREIESRPPAKKVPGAIGLTGRELEVARLIGGGMSNKAIASRLRIKLRTVTTHVSNIHRKLGVSSRHEVAEAIRQAELAGQIKPRSGGRRHRRPSA